MTFLGNARNFWECLKRGHSIIFSKIVPPVSGVLDPLVHGVRLNHLRGQRELVDLNSPSYSDAAVTKIINVTLLLYPGLRLSQPENQQNPNFNPLLKLI